MKNSRKNIFAVATFFVIIQLAPLAFSFSIAYAASKTVGCRTFDVNLMLKDNFNSLNGWVIESLKPTALPIESTSVRVENNTLFVDSFETETTLWNKKRMDGNLIIEFDVRSKKGEHNLNAHFYACFDLSCQETPQSTTNKRTGAYKETFVFQNYIITYLSSLNAITTPLSDWRVRFRKNPGFNLISEKIITKKITSKDFQHITYVFEEDGTMSLYSDNVLLNKHIDTMGALYRNGYHALRIWRTDAEYKNYRIYKIIGILDSSHKCNSFL